MIQRRFTDRTGGVSKGRYESFNLGDHVGDEEQDVARNRLILAEMTATPVFMNQVHGDTVALVEGMSSHWPIADALVTQESGVALCVLVADCVPVLLWDEDEACVGAVHVGRKGLINDIAFKTVEVMRELGAGKIVAEFGPSICGRCYEVGSDVYEEVVSIYPEAGAVQSTFEFALDLPRALEAALQNIDVAVRRSKVCTYESDLHFSYRRDGVTGRAAGIIWLSP